MSCLQVVKNIPASGQDTLAPRDSEPNWHRCGGAPGWDGGENQAENWGYMGEHWGGCREAQGHDWVNTRLGMREAPGWDCEGDTRSHRYGAGGTLRWAWQALWQDRDGAGEVGHRVQRDRTGQHWDGVGNRLSRMRQVQHWDRT